jgi:putative DNA primase/helicase
MTDTRVAMLKAARALVGAGLAALAIAPDTKLPWHKWGHLQDRLPTDGELREYFDRNGVWIGFACGAGSGNVEAIDFDVPGKHGRTPGQTSAPPAYEPWRAMVAEHGGEDLLARLVLASTPSGGVHTLYRCEVIERNRKLAERPSTAEELARNPKQLRQTLIEVRSAGGLVVCAPSPGYRLLQGSYDTIPTISVDERELLLGVARLLDEMPVPPPQETPKRSPTTTAGERVGDAYEAQATWDEILEPHGWRRAARMYGGMQLWIRPGKNAKDGHAARTGVGEVGDRFLCWSSSAGLPMEKPLTKFALYALLNHGDDPEPYRAAARALGQKGYGRPQRPPQSRADRHEAGSSETSAEVVSEPEPRQSFSLSDLGNAERLIHCYGADLRYCSNWGKWLLWNGKHWEIDETGGSCAVQLAIKVVRDMLAESWEIEDKAERGEMAEHAGKCHSRSRIENMVALAKNLPGVPVTPTQLDRHLELISVDNGTLDLRTGELRPHRRDDLITRAIAHPYDPGADCPRWISFLNEIMPDEEVQRYIWKAAGYTLTGLVGEKVFMFLHGSGDNGKSVFVETLMAIFGDYARQTDSETLMAKQQGGGINNDVARLKEARFVAGSETEEGKRLNESLIKRLTGGDTITARYLYQESFEFTPQFKIWISGNHKPVIRGTDPAIWNRVALIPFGVTIPKERQNKLLKYQLIEEEGAGILAWLVDGCMAWRAEGLVKPEAVAGAVSAYKEESDILGAFLNECTYTDTQQILRASHLYASYQAWCKRNNEFCRSQTKFGKAMAERGEPAQRDRNGWFYAGRALVEEEATQHVYRGSTD